MRGHVSAWPAASLRCGGQAGDIAFRRAFHRKLPATTAALLARIYEVFPLTCPKCAAAMRIIAFVTE